METKQLYRYETRGFRRYEPEPRVETRDSNVSELKPRRGGKRPTKQMVADMPSALKRADYALMRILKLEEQIAKLIKIVGPDAATLVIAERPSLKRFI